MNSIFLALSVSTLLKNDVPERLLFSLIFTAIISLLWDIFIYGIWVLFDLFFCFSQSSCILFFKKRIKKILNPACNISAVILAGPTSHLFILKLLSSILIPSKEDTV